jgi:hypothetical protein
MEVDEANDHRVMLSEESLERRHFATAPSPVYTTLGMFTTVF